MERQGVDESSNTGRSYWEQHAQRYDRSMTFLGRPMQRVLELTAEAVEGCGTVLEVGAGTGLVTVAIAPGIQRLVATDYAEAMVAMLKTRLEDSGLANVECLRRDLYALDLPPGSFDAVVAANVLHLVTDLEGALEALRAVLRPGGRVILPTFCHDETRWSWFLSRALAVTGFPGNRRFTASSLRSALEAAGLRIRRTETVPGPIPIVYIDGCWGGL